jgi:hypothetical protein
MSEGNTPGSYSGLCVIGAGFGRTGTSSLKAALEILYPHGPCYHMSEVLARNDCSFWIRAAQHKVSMEEYQQFFSPYAAVVDCPASLFWQDISKSHPHAKVLLSVRDPQKWFESCEKTVFQTDFVTYPRMPFGIYVLSHVVSFWRRYSRMSHMTWGPIFGDDFSRDNCVAVFEQWSDHVKASCPCDGLLVFDVKEGWEPLCSFLGLQVPSVPFPHLNDSAAFQKIIESMNSLGTKVALGFCVTALLTLGVGSIFLLKRRN